MSLQRAAVLVAALVLAGAACDGEDESAAPTTTTAPSTTTTTAAPGAACDVTATDAVRAESGQGPFAVTDLTHDAGRPCEEVAFVFAEVRAGETPDYDVAYAPGPFQDIDGRRVEVEGEVFLRVVLRNATTVDLSGEEPKVADVDPQVDPDSEVVVDIVKVSDFEGQSEWAIGLRQRVGFRVGTDGDRLVIELGRPTGSPG